MVKDLHHRHQHPPNPPAHSPTHTHTHTHTRTHTHTHAHEADSESVLSEGERCKRKGKTEGLRLHSEGDLRQYSYLFFAARVNEASPTDLRPV